MNRTILLLVTIATLSACASDSVVIKKPIPSADTICQGNVTGRTDTKLTYGKDDIGMKWKSFVGRNAEFRILLKPKKGHEEIKVKIVGKWGKLPDSGLSTSTEWLNIEKSAKELEDKGKKPILVLCVPGDVPIGTEYKFDVVVEAVGTLDPRADVTW